MTSTVYRPAAKPTAGITINLNTILGGVGTILIAIVIFMVQGAMKASKTTAETVGTINTQLPYISESIKTTQADVKELRATAVTRTELDNKHNRLQESLKELKGDVKEVQVEQKQVRQDLMKQVINQPKP